MENQLVKVFSAQIRSPHVHSERFIPVETNVEVIFRVNQNINYCESIIIYGVV